MGGRAIICLGVVGRFHEGRQTGLYPSMTVLSPRPWGCLQFMSEMIQGMDFEYVRHAEEFDAKMVYYEDRLMGWYLKIEEHAFPATMLALGPSCSWDCWGRDEIMRESRPLRMIDMGVPGEIGR